MSAIDLNRATLSYMAIGDSFTEGVGDPYPAEAAGRHGEFRGWADRFAEHLADNVAEVRYANLAVRGKLLRQVMSDQLPRVLEVRPDLVTFSAGGNDLLRPGADPDRLARVLEHGVRRLREAGCEVVLFTGVNFTTGYMRALIGTFARYFMGIRSIADRHGCHVVDQWSMDVLTDVRAWDTDRLHMSPEGHRRVALKACETLGVPAEGRWDEPWPPATAPSWRAARRDDVQWARSFLAPWVGRRLTGRSSGDTVTAKRPDLEKVERPAEEIRR
ncbi:lysophospholipase L1-like esterase [Spinactinospora alkalitolerans]|uniref:Lysophospholipase L1-like esterase n=1 Tax=Spinactinospora alkalitolerans TaxID=687207 RepID=A0A852U133_9ACTN|nr:SGNH/GDSL hydrolase family protein [Spinactinospora alkalitolerans]NYE49052.1 lysophospholipase L1-like esterase [Spinactinospora alkalitolerans]